MGVVQNFFLKQMMKQKLKGLPESQQKQILELVEKNPDFFKKLGEEIQAKMKSGKGEMEAAMQVMREHQAEFQNLTR